MSNRDLRPDPPLWIFRLLRKFCPPHLLEEIQGDLMQKFAHDCEHMEPTRARRKLIFNAIFFFRPGIILRNKLNLSRQTPSLASNYFKVSVRQLQRNKVFSLINIVGLGLAFASSLLIFQYVTYELSYDSSLNNRNRIFRVQEDRFKNGVVENRWAPAVGMIGPTLKEDFQEIEEYAQVFPYVLASPAPLISFENKYFKEENTYLATDRFFKIFTGKLVRGQDSSVLKRPLTAVISRSIAQKFFGDSDPVGKQISVDRAQQFEVTGVFEDFPPNSHFHPRVVLSMETMFKSWGNQLTWGNGGFHTYVLLRDGTNQQRFEAKLPEFVTRRAGEQLKIWDEEMVLNLQRVDNIHLDSHFVWEYEENGNRARTYFMGVVGIMIVLIAIINYINLSIAKSMTRAKEVGIRKAIGGLRMQLVQQFMFESVVIHMLALTLGLLILFALSTVAVEWVGVSISLDFFSSRGFWLGLGLIALVSICVSSLYPAMLFSGYNTVTVLKGTPGRLGAGSSFFKALTVAQISVSAVLIILAWCVYAQISFVQQADNGFAKDQILVLRAPNQWDSLYEGSLNAFKRDLMGKNGIEYVVATSDVPGVVPTLRAGGVRKILDPKSASFDCTPPLVDFNYVEMLGLKLLAGRSFSESLGDDFSKVLINEEAMSKLQIKKPSEAIGVHITFWRDTFEIIGVLKNYHHESLRKEILPMVFRLSPYHRGFISIKANGPYFADLIRQAEGSFNIHFAGYPFDYFFMDENFNNQYASDVQLKKVVAGFASIAIVIACIGLFGLSMLAASRRVKEIGIRKVLGATTSSIMILLSRNHVALLIISAAIAVPTSWYLVNRWLEGFVTRMELSAWYFVLPIGVAGFAALAAVSLRTYTAASENPVNSLKHE